jgi:hypothetical protein
MRPVMYRSRTPAPRDRTPLYSPQVLRKKQEDIERAKLTTELAGCTFRPVLRNKRSTSVPPPSSSMASDSASASEAALLQPASHAVPVFERLQQYGKARAAKLQEKKKEVEQREVEGATFRPDIRDSSRSRGRSGVRGPRSVSATSRGSVDASGDVSDAGSVTASDARPGSVFRRLHQEAEALKQRLDLKRRQLLQETGETFAPRISERSRQMADVQRSQVKAGSDAVLKV